MAVMMDAVSNCETSVNSYQTTRRNTQEEIHLHTRRRENLKSHLFQVSFTECFDPVGQPLCTKLWRTNEKLFKLPAYYKEKVRFSAIDGNCHKPHAEHSNYYFRMSHSYLAAV
jgi:hypothetical protein